MTRLGSTRFALTAEERGPQLFPSLRTLSAAFIYSFVPLPDEKLAPEYVTVHVRGVEERLFVAEWNTMWEAGYLRSLRDEASLPAGFDWLARFQGRNIYFLPAGASAGGTPWERPPTCSGASGWPAILTSPEDRVG